MFGRSFLFVLATLTAVVGVAAPVVAEEVVVVERGTDGLIAVPFRALDRSAGPMVCSAAIAHWYSVEIGRAEPGAAVTATLWSNPATGAIHLLNDHQDRMPIQTLWCGVAGRDASTRSDVPLARRRGGAESPIDLVCTEASAGDRLACRPRGVD